MFLILLSLTINPYGGYNNNAEKSMHANSIGILENQNGLFKILELTFDLGARGTAWIDVIKNENADIILVTETGSWKSADGSFQNAVDQINALFPDEIPYEGFTSEPEPGFLNDGQTILSRYPIVESKSVVDLKLDDGSDYAIIRNVTHVTIEINDLSINFLTAHFRCCDAESHRMLESESLINYLDDLGNVPILFAGDLNSDSSLDTEDLQSPFSTLGIEGIDAWTNRSNPKSSTIHNFTDVYRSLNPNNPGFTYHSPLYSSRTDYIFINDWLTDAMVNSSVSDFYQAGIDMSDHFPLTAWFNLNHDITDLRPPLPVHGLDAEVNLSTNKISISWAENIENDLFKYQLFRNAPIQQCLLTEVPFEQTNFVDDILIHPKEIYKYHLTAVDNVGNIATLSLPLYVNSSSGILTKPSTVILHATGVEGGIQLNWTLQDNGGVEDMFYDVYRAGSEELTKVLRGTTNQMKYFDSLVAGTQVYYWVVAKNIIGKSAFSDSATAISKYSMESQLKLAKVSEENNIQLTGLFSVHQDLSCPVPLNLIELPKLTSTSTSSTVVTTSSSASSSSIETSTKSETFLEISVVMLTIYPILIIVKRRKQL